MKEEILTAIEWVCKETGNTPQMYQLPDFNLLEPLMEGYANYKNRILEDRIKEFRQLMAKPWFENSEDKNTGDWIKELDKHFKND